MGPRKRAYEALCDRGRGMVAHAEALVRGLPTAPTIQARADQESRLSSPRQARKMVRGLVHTPQAPPLR